MVEPYSPQPLIRRLELLHRKIGKMLETLRVQEAQLQDLWRETAELFGQEAAASSLGAEVPALTGAPKKRQSGSRKSRVRRHRRCSDVLIELLEEKQPQSQSELRKGLKDAGHKFSRQAVSYALRSLQEHKAITRADAGPGDPKAVYLYQLSEDREDGTPPKKP